MAKHTPIFILLSSLVILSSFFLPWASGQEQKPTDLQIFLGEKFKRTTEYDGGFAFGARLIYGVTEKPWGRAEGTATFLNAENREDVFVSMAFLANGTLDDTLVAVGRTNLSDNFRQIPIVGGTGKYTTTRGIATGNLDIVYEQLYVYRFELQFVQDDILSSPRMKM